MIVLVNIMMLISSSTRRRRSEGDLALSTLLHRGNESSLVTSTALAFFLLLNSNSDHMIIKLHPRRYELEVAFFSYSLLQMSMTLMISLTAAVD